MLSVPAPNPATRMTRWLWLVLGAASCKAKPAEEPFSPAHAAALRDSVSLTLLDYRSRFNARDTDSLLAFYADDPRWVWAAEGKVARQSRSLIKSQLESLTGLTHWRIRYNKMEIVPLAPGLAFATTEYAMRFGDSLVTRLRFVGALTMFWIHTPAGWKISGGHSSTLPAAVAGAPRCFRSEHSVLLGPPTPRGQQGKGPGWIRLEGGLQFDSGAATLADRDGKRLSATWVWEDSTRLKLIGRDDFLRVELGFQLSEGQILGIGKAHSDAALERDAQGRLVELRRAWTVQADEAPCDSMPRNRAER